MEVIHNVRWRDLNDRRDRTLALFCIAATGAAWGVVIAGVVWFWS